MTSPLSRWVAALVLAGLAALAGAAPPAPFQHGVLYRVERDGRPASFVFGTLHSNDPRVTVLPPAVEAALGGSRRLAIEIMLSDAELPQFFEAAQYDDGRRLGDHFDAATKSRIRAALGSAAPAEAVFERLKPWAVLLMLAQPRSADAAPTLDANLVDAAHRRRMTIIGLELPQEQVAALDSIPVASQVALVRWTLDHQGSLTSYNKDTIAAWLKRDLKRLHELARAPGGPDPAMAPHFVALTRHVVENRSQLMAHRLFLPLRDGGVFVAVGALHLYGSQGLLALLVRQGYRVRRLL